MQNSSLNRFSVATLLLFTSALLLHPDHSQARPGMRGGAATSISRPAGGMNRGGAPMARANTGNRMNANTRVNDGTRVNGNTRVNGGTRINGGSTVNGGARINGGTRVNNNVRNVNVNNVNIDNHGGWGGYGYDDHYHPIAAGVAIGAAAAVTSAVIGSMMYSLPPACAPRPYGGMTYYYCNGAWYQPQYQGDQVTYIVVNAPG